MKKAFFVLVSLVLYVSASEPDISFSFNNSLNHDKAFTLFNSTRKGSMRPVIPKDIIDEKKLLVAGKFGKALHIGSINGKKGFDRVMYFFANGIVKGTEGAISFLVNPVDWEPANRKNHVLIRLHTLVKGKDQDSIVVVVRNQNNKTNIRMLYGIIEGGNNFTSLNASKAVWQKNQWHHIVATWGKGKLFIYIDGEYAASCNMTPNKNAYNLLSLGQQWEKNPGSTLLDEVRIFRKQLNDNEVKEEYTRNIQAKDKANTIRPFELALTNRTPIVNGIITPGEYSAGFALMSEGGKRAKNGSYAEYQPNCYFAYDKNNLYLAMKSRGDDLRSTITTLDGNVWEDDCIDFYFSSKGQAKDMYHFIINSAGIIYDSQLQNGVEKKRWNAKNISVKNKVINGQWHWEAAIPWSNFKVVPKLGESFYFNICRSFRGITHLLKTDDLGKGKVDNKVKVRSCTVSLAPGAMNDVRQFAKVKFTQNTPAFELTSLGELSCQGNFSSNISFYPSKNDNAIVKINAGALNSNQSSKTLSLIKGKKSQVNLAGKWAQEGTLKVQLATKSMELFKGYVNYKEPNMVKFKSFRADPEKMQLVVVATGGDNSFRKCSLLVKMVDWKTKKVAYQQKQLFSVVRGDITLRFDIKNLPPGLYDMHYEFLDSTGKVLAKDFEYFAKPNGKAPWEGTTAGLGDIVPVPWIPVKANNNLFACWGRNYKLGSNNIVSSIVSQRKELLSRPVTLLLNGNAVKFNAKLVKVGKSFADYQLTSLGNIPLTLDIHLEFDGFMWCTLKVGKKGFKVNSLRLDIPVTRRYATAFDDCSSIYEKIDFSAWKNQTIYNNPTKKPYFWIGNANVGLMAGVDNCRGWYIKNKDKGYSLTITDKEAIVSMQFVDTPIELNAPRKIEFYLQATPTKVKSKEAASLFTHEYHNNWYATRFYEWKAEGVVQENTMKRFLPKRQGLEKCHAFYYYGTKGASPHFPWWAWFGSQWNMVGDPTRFNQDSVIDSRRQRDYAIWTMTCMNSKSFLEHKIDMVKWHLSVDRYKVYDLYFDLAWPMPCYNDVHKCRWVDEFGYIHYNQDMKNLREFHKRAYILMKHKNPNSLMKGHIRYTRLPSDVFFDVLLVGEGYEGQVSEKHNYYDILDPSVLQILYGFRTNEFTIELGPIQIYRTIFMFSPKLLKTFNPKNPEIDKAHRHFYAYAKCMNFVAKSSRPEKEPQLDLGNEAFRKLGRNPKFYPQWDKNSGISSPNKDKKFLYSAYSGNNKVMIIALNDSDKAVTRKIAINPAKLVVSNVLGVDIFNKKKYTIEDNTLTFTLLPRESAFVLF